MRNHDFMSPVAERFTCISSAFHDVLDSVPPQIIQALLTLFFQCSRAGDSLSQDWASLSCSSGEKPWLNGRILIFCSMKFRGS